MQSIQMVSSIIARFYVIFLVSIIVNITIDGSLYIQGVVIAAVMLYSFIDLFNFSVTSFGFYIHSRWDKWYLKVIGSTINFLINIVLIYFAIYEVYTFALVYFIIETIIYINFKITFTEFITLKRYLVKEWDAIKI